MFVVHTPWGDNELMRLMKLKEESCLSFGKVGEILGRSRNSCAGAYSRIIRELKQSEALK